MSYDCGSDVGSLNPKQRPFGVAILLASLLVFLVFFLAKKEKDESREAELSSTSLGAVESSVPRSPKWPKERALYLIDHPACEACGRTHDTQVHHVVPFHVNKSLELDRSNFIGLCGPHGCNAHFRIGHLGDWRKANPNVRRDAAWERKCK